MSSNKAINKLLVWCLVGLIAPAGTALAQDKTTDFYGEIQDNDHPQGYREYVEYGCWQCHGFQGQGAGSAALISPLMPYEAFAHQVRRPRNVMPPYSPDVLDDNTLERIYGYLQQVPPPPEVSDIPLLSQGR